MDWHPPFCRGVTGTSQHAASGLYVSKDGESWKLATESLEFLQGYSATAVAAQPPRSNQADSKIESTEEKSTAHVFLGLAGGILISHDGGRNWFSAQTPKPPPVISCLVVSPDYEQDGILLAGSLEDGVIRSADNGRSWVSWNFGLLDLAVMSMAISPNFAEDETVLAGTESGLFRSTNGGRAWREVALPAGYDPVMSLAVSPRFGWMDGKSGTILAGLESNGLYRSDDRGVNWQKVEEAQFEGIVQNIVFSPKYPEEPAILVVAEGKIFLSRDDGESWKELWAEITGIQPAAAVLALEGMVAGRESWVGMANGEVLHLQFD